jgi:phosphatidylinositol glycan class Z
LIAVAVRLLFVFIGFGYIHPDAFFQSSEVIANDVFGFETERTWEFERANPCRSIVVPAIFSGIPFLVLKAISVIIPSVVNGYTLYYLPRLFLFVTSFILDWIVWKLSKEDPDAILTLATSWVMFSYMLTPFSNTAEAIILAITIYIVLRTKGKSWHEYVLIGGLIAFGEFSRITFILYAFPLVLFLLYEELTKKRKRLGESPYWYSVWIQCSFCYNYYN